jgi:hypothetical protein
VGFVRVQADLAACLPDVLLESLDLEPFELPEADELDDSDEEDEDDEDDDEVLDEVDSLDSLSFFGLLADFDPLRESVL